MIYGPDEQFPVGGSKVVRSSDKDEVTIVAAGITLHNALAAYDQLKSQGIRARVIDAYTIKPIDEETLYTAAEEAGNCIVTVEDHWPEGGLGEAVAGTLADAAHRPPIVRLAVRDMPMSGKPAELLHAAGIDAAAIVEAIRPLNSGSR